MPTPRGRWLGHARRLTVLGLALFGLSLIMSGLLGAGALEEPALVVQTLPGGAVRASATLHFPVPRALLHAVLTDYAHWPDLFDVRMKLIRFEPHEGGAVTDLAIQHLLLPGERRLVCDSQETPDGGLVTSLIGGDFRQYRRVWRLSADEGGHATRADFEILVEVDTLAPSWLVALGLRRELDAHFRIVREKAISRLRAR